MPKISIVIPVYNSEKYLSEALNSVIGQSFEDIEVLCVNDGSTDNSLQILHSYKERDNRVKIINQQNGGGSAARNNGLKHATGDYVMFLDSDDMYAPEVISNAYMRAINTNADIVMYNFARFVGKPTMLAVKSKITPGKSIDYFTKSDYVERLFNDFATITWNKLIRRSVLEKNKILFDTKLSHNHDVDFSIRLMLSAGSFSWLDVVGYYYRKNDTGITATKRNDPTNVLKILLDLNKLVVAQEGGLKQSFDNYVAEMIIGTLEKYSDNSTQQKEVFDFAHKTALAVTSPNEKPENYIYNKSLIIPLRLVERGNYLDYVAYDKTLKRRLRAHLRKSYDAVQLIISRFAV